MKPKMRQAVFFDRDGTLNEEVGHVDDAARFRVYPFAGRAVREINEAGLLAIVVTNQSGVGRGIFAEDLVARVHQQLGHELRTAGARLDRIYYCPHHPEAEIAAYRQQCACRKPSPGMLQQAAVEFGIQLQRSFVVGDRYVDMEMAHRVGAASVLVMTGFGQTEWEQEQSRWPQPPDHVAANVYEAVQWIRGRLADEER
jgi:D-glycero-D-manno-heptose 1,7-bisphosphate phosphatase